MAFGAQIDAPTNIDAQIKWNRCHLENIFGLQILTGFIIGKYAKKIFHLKYLPTS